MYFTIQELAFSSARGKNFMGPYAAAAAAPSLGTAAVNYYFIKRCYINCS
jgi:hypothetical protein